MKNITITEIAKTAGLSISTVSKAFSNSTDISEATKAKVLKCAVELGYAIGTKTKEGKGTIAMIVEGLDHTDSNTFEYQMLFGFQYAASSKGYSVEVIQKPHTPDSGWSYKENVTDKNYSGVFILRIDYNNIEQQIINSNIPTIIFDHELNAKNVAYIGCDNQAGIKIAVEHLVSLGHKKIAFYGGTPMILVSVARKSAFIRALRDNSLSVDPELIFETNFAQNYAKDIIPTIIEKGATAIVCSSDMLAYYALTELQRININVPKDISIIGFDNVPLCEETTPKLSSISQSSMEIGRGAFYALQRIQQNIHISTMLYRPSLVERESTAKAKT